MEKIYAVSSFEALGGFNCRGEWKEKKTSLLSILEDRLHFHVPENTKRLFEEKRLVFSCEGMTMAELQRAIAQGVAVFPINVSTSVDEVINYLKLGLEVKFMRDRDFRQFKKDYTLSA